MAGADRVVIRHRTVLNLEWSRSGRGTGGRRRWLTDLRRAWRRRRFMWGCELGLVAAAATLGAGGAQGGLPLFQNVAIPARTGSLGQVQRVWHSHLRGLSPDSAGPLGLATHSGGGGNGQRRMRTSDSTARPLTANFNVIGKRSIQQLRNNGLMMLLLTMPTKRDQTSRSQIIYQNLR